MNRNVYKLVFDKICDSNVNYCHLLFPNHGRQSFNGYTFLSYKNTKFKVKNGAVIIH